MRLVEVNEGLELVIVHYDEVIARLQAQKTRNKRKCDYREVLDEYLATRNFAQTGRAFDLSDSGAYLVVYKAIRIAQDIVNPPRPKCKCRKRHGPVR